MLLLLFLCFILALSFRNIRDYFSNKAGKEAGISFDNMPVEEIFDEIKTLVKKGNKSAKIAYFSYFINIFFIFIGYILIFFIIGNSLNG